MIDLMHFYRSVQWDPSEIILKTSTVLGLHATFADISASSRRGGKGPVPLSAMPSIHAEPCTENLLCYLPKITTAQALETFSHSVCWIAWAEGGLFAFDWRDVHRTLSEARHVYELVCRPADAITVEQLPPELQALARATKLNAVFAESDEIAIHPPASYSPASG